jgi:hypothetical protein
MTASGGTEPAWFMVAIVDHLCSAPEHPQLCRSVAGWADEYLIKDIYFFLTFILSPGPFDAPLGVRNGVPHLPSP